jgi:hypothetical protein
MFACGLHAYWCKLEGGPAYHGLSGQGWFVVGVTKGLKAAIVAFSFCYGLPHLGLSYFLLCAFNLLAKEPDNMAASVES